MSALLDKAIAAGMLLALVMAALAFGTTEPWSVAVFELAMITLALMWAIKAVSDKRLKIRVPTTALPLAAFLLMGLAQSISLGGEGNARSLSMDVEATRRAVTVLFFLFVAFIIAANFFATRERLRWLVNFLIIYGVLFAVFALVQHFTWDGRLYWVRPTAWNSVFGPFANRNHFAGYMEMLVPLPVALIAARSERKDAWLLYGFAAAMMGMSIVVSLSRGGMISVAAGLIFIAFLGPRLSRRAERGARKKTSFRFIPDSLSSALMRAGAVIVIALAITAGVVWVGAEGVIDRAAESIKQMNKIGAEPQYWTREWIWKDTWAMIGAHPVLGVGLGAYETAFPIYGHGDGTLTVDYAHNDYLQALADGGIPGGLIALWFIVLIFRALARGLRSQDSLLAGIALGGGAGIFSMLVHSLFDFNLQIPSNALLFLFLSAVVSSIGAMASERDAEKTLERPD